MESRALGRTGRRVSAIGLGTWQIGADWGEVSDDDAMRTLHAAVDWGVTFIDTADVYGDGRSERLVGRLMRERPEAEITVATKVGRRADPHVTEAYSSENLRRWTDRSRENLQMEKLHLVQLHCPPTQLYAQDAVFDAMDELVAEGRMVSYGISVETCAEALAAIARPHVATVQIILNCFRQRPLDDVLPAARDAGVGIIARVPLASGLLSGKYDEDTTFPPDDHRAYNRRGEAFDVGETFAGVPFEVGVRAARELSEGLPSTGTTAQLALRWVLDQDGVSTVIPGARNKEQAEFNSRAADLPPLDQQTHNHVRDVYERSIAPLVDHRW